tara:strand:- start:309 stop:686 length:378 start_codon:yes stop_codon:yes gene_type:complete
MNNEEINFCDNCYNLTFFHLDTEDNKLYHVCKVCSTTKEFIGGNNCIFSNTFQDYDKSVFINTNKYVTHDKTLPSINGNFNLKCPNEECITKKENIKGSFKYIKYDIENMKYIYICENCGQKWNN